MKQMGQGKMVTINSAQIDEQSGGKTNFLENMDQILMRGIP